MIPLSYPPANTTKSAVCLLSTTPIVLSIKQSDTKAELTGMSLRYTGKHLLKVSKHAFHQDLLTIKVFNKYRDVHSYEFRKLNSHLDLDLK